MNNIASNNIADETLSTNVNNILLDIHRDAVNSTKCDTKKITLILAKNSPYYEENKVFDGNLLQNINSSNEIKTEIIWYNRGKLCFNQDLSKNALIINLGNNMSSDSDIEKCVNALVSSNGHRQHFQQNTF